MLQSPQPEISGPAIVCENDVADYSTQENSGSSYTWEVEGGIINSGAGTHQVTVQWGSYGTAYIMVTEDNGTCADSSDHYMVQIDECTSIDELDDNEFKIYPNPATSKLMIECISLNEDEGFEIQVWNVQGKLIENLIVTPGKDYTELNVEHYQEGVYFVKVITDSRQFKRASFVVSH